MLWRHLSRFRAWSAAGYLTCTVFAAAGTAWAEPEGPVPSADAAASETVSVLDAVKTGDLAVEVRGAGQDRVKMTVKNTTKRRLRVVLPPGLVASSAAGQAGGRGFQSMGLGSVSNKVGSFGAFQTRKSDEPSGFRSVTANGEESDLGVAVPAGLTVDLTVVSVCLNFGVRTPNAHDKFQLVDVDDYTTDPRARKTALRSLATYGTSHGVAQAAMWRVSNDVPFALMTEQSGKVMNAHEVALAVRFVEALDASASGDLVDPVYLTDNRLFVRVSAEGSLAKDAERLGREIEGLRILGLPVRTPDSTEAHAATGPAVMLNVTLAAGPNGETRGRILLSLADTSGRWTPLGKTTFSDGSSLSVLDGEGLARAVDRAVASAYVTVKVTKKLSNVTMIRVENRLPFTLSNLTLRAGHSSGALTVAFPGVGIAPARSGVVPIQAATASVDHVEFNGL